MEELIAQIASSVGIDEELSSKAIGIILNFLNSSAPAEKMAELTDAIPGMSDVIGESEGGGGMFSGMMGAMGVMNDLNSAGLSQGQVIDVTKELVSFAKEKAGEDTVNDIISSVPGLSQFI